MTPLLLLLLAQNLNVQPIEVRQGGVKVPSKVRQWAVDCSGSATCSVDGGVWYLTTAAGGGGSGLPADPAACPAGQYVTDQNASGVLTCSTPPGTYVLPDATSLVTGGVRLTGDLAGTATSPAVVDDSHNHTGATISGLTSGSAILLGNGSGGFSSYAGDTCTGTDKVKAISAGGVLTCAADATGGGGGGGNWGNFAISFGGDAGVASFDSEVKTIAAVWVSGTSDIIFTAKCSVLDGGVTAEECSLVRPDCSVVAQVASTSFDVRCVSEVGGFGPYFVSYTGAN